MEVVIIGGSAAGLKAACRISRLQPDAGVRVLVREERFAYSNCGLPYYVSGDIESFEELIKAPNGIIKDEKYFRDVKGFEVLSGREVTTIDRAARLIRCSNLNRSGDETYPYDRLVIATGAIPIIPAIPGTDVTGVMTFNRAEDAIRLRSDLEANRIDKVVIIGAGLIGLELCDALRALWGVDVELIELRSHVLAGLVDQELASLIEEEILTQGISLQLGCRCREIVEDDGKVCIFDNSGDMIKADRIILTSGVKPNVELALNARLEIGISGGIKVNSHLRTSDPDIYAAGDCVELPNAVDGRENCWALGSLASRMGRVVGDNICNGDSRFGPVVGTTIIKLFDMTIGTAGLTRSYCIDQGYKFEETWVTLHDRLHYYPEVGAIKAKVIYDPSDGRILGFQAVSNAQLLHTLDIASQIIHTGGTLDDLNDVEHAYSPPFAQPFEPLHLLSYIAENSHIAGIKLVSPVEFDNLPSNFLILDVRTPAEKESRPLATGIRRRIEIPVEELRSKLGEIENDIPIVAVCQMGGRAWDAALMLRRAGYSDVGILAGGALFLPLKS